MVEDLEHLLALFVKELIRGRRAKIYICATGTDDEPVYTLQIDLNGLLLAYDLSQTGLVLFIDLEKKLKEPTAFQNQNQLIEDYIFENSGEAKPILSVGISYLLGGK